MAVIEPPTTYLEWLSCLDALSQGGADEELLQAMEAGRLDWSSGVAERFVARLGGCLDLRLKQAAAALQRDLDASAGREALLVAALIDARRRFLVVQRVARLPSLPEHVREELGRAIQRYADQAQAGLEQSAQHDRTGRLQSLLRGTALNRAECSSAVPASSVPATGPRRRVILG